MFGMAFTSKMRTPFETISVRRLAALAAIVVAAAGVTVQSASAAAYTWYSVPSYAGANGAAIIDSYHNNCLTCGYAQGRVKLDPNGRCMHIQYALFADAALDGSWKNLPTNCGWTTVTMNWSDDFHWYPDGVKFRVCTTSSCGSNRYIYF
jgi:hypothetical protein